jgi:hypothetical protein
VNPEDKTYGFRFVCKDFEIEIRGDQRFVEKTLGRYENKVMQKLREFFPHGPSPEHREPEAPRPSAPAPAHHPPAAPAEPASASPAGEKKSRRRRGRGRRGKRHQESQETAASRIEHEPQPVSAMPLLRKEGTALEATLPFSEGPALLEEPAAPAFTHPPLEDVRPAATDFPGRRRTPKVEPRTLKALLEEKRPRTHHDRIMLMGFHLENAAGGSDFTAEELTGCYQAANETLPANLTQVLNHATRSGFILRHDQGRIQRFKLSARGRRYVEDGMKLL